MSKIKSGGTYATSNKEFKEKYNSQIVGIALKNNVDMSVATEMFKTNLDNSNTGVLNSSNEYKGAGTITSNQKDDWKDLKNVATKETNDRGLSYLLEREDEKKK